MGRVKSSLCPLKNILNNDRDTECRLQFPIAGYSPHPCFSLTMDRTLHPHVPCCQSCDRRTEVSPTKSIVFFVDFHYLHFPRWYIITTGSRKSSADIPHQHLAVWQLCDHMVPDELHKTQLPEPNQFSDTAPPCRAGLDETKFGVDWPQLAVQGDESLHQDDGAGRLCARGSEQGPGL